MSLREIAEKIAINCPRQPLSAYQTIPGVDKPALADAIEAALLAERERCAKIAEDESCGLSCHAKIATAIRTDAKENHDG